MAKAKVYSIQPRFRSVDDSQTHGSWAMIRDIMQMGGGNLPSYGMIERDAYLSYSWQDEPMTAGAFSTWVEKLQTVQWTVRGGKINAISFAKMLAAANWPVMIGELGLDYLICDKGCMMELGRAGQGSSNGRVLGIQQIDPTRMVYTGNVGKRWRYYPSIPVKGTSRSGVVDLPDANLISIRSLPLGRDRFRGLGFSPLSRLLDAKRLMVGYLTYYRQEIGDLPPELVVIINGLAATEVEDSHAKYMLDRESKGLSTYPKTWWLGSDDPSAPVTLTQHSFTSPNKAFRYEQMVEWWIKTLALNTGEDVGEYWLIQHSGATKASQSVQAAKSRGKGTARFMADLEGRMNNEVMPFGTFFAFDNPDDEQDQIRADILSVNVNSVKTMAETMIGGAAGTGGDPVYAKEELRQLAVDMGIMPEDFGAEQVPHVVGSVLKSISDNEDNWIVGPSGRASRVVPLLHGKDARDAMTIYQTFKDMFGGRSGQGNGSLPSESLIEEPVPSIEEV